MVSVIIGTVFEGGQESAVPEKVSGKDVEA